MTFAYDLNGIRTSKTVSGVTHNYLYASGKLMRETYSNKTLDFFYDNAGYPYALKYNGTTYYYITNLQGDVMGLVNSSGTSVASYTYDPYGKVLTATGTMANVNPLRYRGYYYDTETGFYYLQSRYYDPAIGRFISADEYTYTGQEFIGCSMFAYCGNNPILRKDDGGRFWNIVGGALVGALVGGIVKAASNIMAGEEWSNGLATAMAAGAVSGGLAASGVGLAGQIIGNAVIGMANNATDQIISNKGFTNFSVGSMLVDGAIGAAAGWAGGSGAGNKGLTNYGKQVINRAVDALTHKGVNAAISEGAKAMAYFAKNARHIVKPLIKSFTKSAAAAITGNAVKVFVALV